MRQLPSLTHLQFLVIGVLVEGPAAGRTLRARLKEHGARKSGPAFYQLMARLEDAGLVTGWYEKQALEHQTVRERHYRVAAAGRKAWRVSRDFYARAPGRSARAGGLAHA